MCVCMVVLRPVLGGSMGNRSFLLFSLGLLQWPSPQRSIDTGIWKRSYTLCLYDMHALTSLPWL